MSTDIQAGKSYKGEVEDLNAAYMIEKHRLPAMETAAGEADSSALLSEEATLLKP